VGVVLGEDSGRRLEPWKKPVIEDLAVYDT
jgi:hypothetical protein